MLIELEGDMLLKPDFNFSIGYSKSNIGDEVYYNTYAVNICNTKLPFQVEGSFYERIDTYEQALEIGLLEGLKLINV